MKPEPSNPSRATASGLKIVPVPGWLACATALSPCCSALGHLMRLLGYKGRTGPSSACPWELPPSSALGQGQRRVQGVGLSPPFRQLQKHTSRRKFTEQQVYGCHFMDGETEAWEGKVTPTTSGPESRSPVSQAGTLHPTKEQVAI